MKYVCNSSDFGETEVDYWFPIRDWFNTSQLTMLHASQHVHLITQWCTAGILSAYWSHCVQCNFFPSGQPFTETDLLIHYKTKYPDLLMLVITKCTSVIQRSSFKDVLMGNSNFCHLGSLKTSKNTLWRVNLALQLFCMALFLSCVQLSLKLTED